jgi:hypothetical protein
VQTTSTYRDAIDLTVAIIVRRAALFRNQIVTIVVSGLLAIVATAVLHSVWPLLVILYWIPIGAFFVYLDNRAVEDWRRALFVHWIDKTLDFVALGSAVRALPTLPKETVAAMLATVPTAGDLPAERNIAQAARRAVALAAGVVQRRRLRFFLAQAIASTVAVTALAVALRARFAGWLFALAVVLVIASATAVVAAGRGH